jgi:hypothetical protein
VKYSKQFYRDQGPGSLRSAREIIPLIMDMVRPRSVVDVGCGVGAWLSVFLDHGVQDILGIDSVDVPVDLLMVPRKVFQSTDLSQPAPINRVFDLAVSVEVVEHLPMNASDVFVAFLTSLAPVVVFAAAVPFQGGTGHINEQWPDFWVELFRKRGYAVVDAFRPQVWSNENVEPFYRQNLLLFVKESLLSRYPAIEQAHAHDRAGFLSIVHPSIYVGRNQYPLASPGHLVLWALRLAGSRMKRCILELLPKRG